MHQFPGPRVAVVYHCSHGPTAKQAQAAARGAASIHGVQSLLIRLAQIDHYWDTLERMDAVIFGSPTCMGSVSKQFKAFMDASSGHVLAKGLAWTNKLAAGFTNVASRSGDMLTALQQLSAFAAQHGMHWVSIGLPPGHESAKSHQEDLGWNGLLLGAVSLSRGGEGACVAPPLADLRMAEMLGARVANVAWQLLAGRLALQTLTLPLDEDLRVG